MGLRGCVAGVVFDCVYFLMIKHEFIEKLRSCLSYDPETGFFTWRIDSKNGRIKSGDVAGTNSCGYCRIKIDGRMWMAHRLAFLMMGLEEPPQVDHIDGNRSNNSWGNLRAASHVENMQNIKSARTTNKLGSLGVSRIGGGKFEARIRFCGKQIRIGYFENEDLAKEAYLRAKRIFHHFNTL